MKDDLAKHEIFPDHWRSTFLPKRQMDFVTANDHAKSAIIAYNVDRVDASEALSPDSYDL